MTEALTQIWRSPHSFEKIWLWGVKIGVFSILLTPLVISSFTTFPSIFPKTIYFRTLVEIVFLFYIFLLIINRKYLPKLSPIFIAVFILIEILAFSSLKGINPERSFWGTIERMEGLILYLHLFIFFIVLVGVFQQKKDWFNLLRFTVLLSIPVGLAGMAQKLGIFYFFTNPADPRISSTLGNPVLYGSYLTLIIFLAIFLGISEEKKKFRILFWLITIFNFFLLLLTGTRGAWIGVGVGSGFLLLAWFLFFSKRAKEKRKALLFGVFILLLFFLLFYLFSEMGYLPKNYVLERYEAFWIQLIEFDKNSRFLVWQLGFEAFRDSPLFGYGPESFSYIYDKYYRASFLEVISESIFFDRAHNKIVDTLVTSGLLGLVSYLALFAITFFVILKNHKEIFSRFLSFVLIALLLSYFIQNIFAFDTINSYVIFFLVLGFIDINFRQTKNNTDSKKEKRNRLSNHSDSSTTQPIPWGKISIGILTFLVTIIVIFVVNIRPLLANFKLAEAHQLMADGEPKKAFQSLELALRGPGFTQFETYYYGSETIFFAIPQYKSLEKEFSEELQKIIKPLEEHLEEKAEIFQMRGYLLLAQIYKTLYLIEKDSKYLENEEKVLGKAIKLNPQFPRIYRLAGEMRILQKRGEEAQVFFAKAYELDKSWTNFYEWLGRSFMEINEKEKGVEALRKSLKIGDFYTKEKFNLKIIWRLADVYEELGDYQEMADFYEEVISRYPADKPHPQLYASLSTVYAKIGEKDKARQITEQMLKFYPELRAQAEEFLSTLEEE